MTTEQMDETDGLRRLGVEARMGGDLDKARATLSENTMAEEPIEDRLRRAWLNGFREGVEMAGWKNGQWDHR